MAAADLRAMIERLIRDALPLRQLNVAAIVGPTTVDLAYGDARIASVSCSSAYTHRQVGDKVWVIKSPAGNWEVLCRSGATDTHPPTP